MSASIWLAQTSATSMLRLAQTWWLCRLCHNARQVAHGGTSFVPCRLCAGRLHASPLSSRKLRLIACAACRFLGDELTGDPAHEAVQVAERRAEGLASDAALHRAGQKATAPAAVAACLPSAWDAAQRATEAVLARLAALQEEALATDLRAELAQVDANAEARGGSLSRSAVKAIRRTGERRIREHFAQQVSQAVSKANRALAAMFFDLLGNPFEPVRIDGRWLEAGNGHVRQVAAGIEVEGAYDEMPVLADALQDAGCTDARLLDHCLQDHHWRGCWLIDVCLGRE